MTMSVDGGAAEGGPARAQQIQPGSLSVNCDKCLQQTVWVTNFLCSVSIYMFRPADGDVGMCLIPTGSAGLKGRRTRSWSLAMVNRL